MQIVGGKEASRVQRDCGYLIKYTEHHMNCAIC